MTTAEIIGLSREEKCIYIVKEALFCKVYEESAWRFVLLLRSYKPCKKFFKNINQEIVSIGFPKTQLDGIREEAMVKGFRLEKEEAGFLMFSAASEPDRSFTEWKNEIKLNSSGEEKTVAMNNHLLMEEAWDIIQELESFPLVSSTPLQSMQFLMDLQQKARLVRKMPE